jgi:hypothetical protein
MRAGALAEQGDAVRIHVAARDHPVDARHDVSDVHHRVALPRSFSITPGPYGAAVR